MKTPIATIVCLSAAVACTDAPAVQPIAFNHRVHNSDNGLECDSCHEHVRDRASAGMPATKSCMECHSSDITTSTAAHAEIEVLRRYARQKEEVPWVRLYALQPHVYFSHRRHVGIAGLECSRCHGPIAEATRPPERPVASTLEMRACMSCHRDQRVENDCAWCHR